MEGALIFVTDIHDALAHARALRAGLPPGDVADALLLVGGDLTSFGGVVRARTVLTELGLGFRRLLAVAGNTDMPEVGRWLSELGVTLEGRPVVDRGVGYIGCGGSNRTPMVTPNERDEDEIARCLDNAYRGLEQLGGWDRVVVVSHCPPADTSTDRTHSGQHVGSKALRAFLEDHPVDLCLCGHIHESMGIDEVAGSVVCNPGSLAWGGYASVTWQEGRPVCRMEQVSVGAFEGGLENVSGAVRKLAGYAAWRIADLVGRSL